MVNIFYMYFSSKNSQKIIYSHIINRKINIMHRRNKYLKRNNLTKYQSTLPLFSKRIQLQC